MSCITFWNGDRTSLVVMNLIKKQGGSMLFEVMTQHLFISAKTSVWIEVVSIAALHGMLCGIRDMETDTFFKTADGTLCIDVERDAFGHVKEIIKVSDLQYGCNVRQEFSVDVTFLEGVINDLASCMRLTTENIATDEYGKASTAFSLHHLKRRIDCSTEFFQMQLNACAPFFSVENLPITLYQDEFYKLKRGLHELLDVHDSRKIYFHPVDYPGLDICFERKLDNFYISGEVPEVKRESECVLSLYMEVRREQLERMFRAL